MTRRSAARASISGVALVLALLATLLGGPPAQAAGGTLAGTLTDPGGDPVTYFRVEVFRADGTGGWEHAIAPRTFAPWSSGLDPGEFAISLPAGSYRACFADAGYEYAETTGRTCWQGAYEVFEATDITVAEGGTTTVTPALPRESRLHGRITGPGGVPVSAYVAAHQRRPDGTWGTWSGGVQSLADGTFAVEDLDPGRYRVCLYDVPREFIAECWKDQAHLGSADEITVPENASMLLAFRLARRASITGVVSRPVGSTQPVYVTPQAWTGQRWAPIMGGSTIEPEGGYRITGLDAGTYRVCATGFDVVTTCWRRGTSADEGVDIVLATSEQRGGVNLSPGAAGFVTGTLPDVYLGAEGYPGVTAWRRVDGGWRVEATGDASPSGAGSDWAYEIGSLRSGTYVVCVEHLEPEFVPAFPHTCRDDSPTPAGGTPFEVVAGETTSGIDIATGLAGEIRGRVTGAPGPVRVDLFTAAGRLALSQVTDADGGYRFREVPTGTFYVGFHREPATSSLSAEWWRNRTDGLGIAAATPIAVDGTVVTGVGAVLDPGGTITGRVVDDDGTPVTGCPVRARAADHSLAVRRGVTDGTGGFAIHGLSTAQYLVVVDHRCSGTPTSMLYDAESPTHTSARLLDADPVAVTRGATSTLPVDLVTGVPAIGNTDPPTITGTPAVGRTLTAGPGSWRPTSGLDYRYRWFAGPDLIAGADTRRLLLTSEHAGERIRVRVIATARGWASGLRTSAPVGPVAP